MADGGERFVAAQAAGAGFDDVEPFGPVERDGRRVADEDDDPDVGVGSGASQLP